MSKNALHINFNIICNNITKINNIISYLNMIILLHICLLFLIKLYLYKIFISQKHKHELVSQLENSSVITTTLDLLQWLMGPDAGGPSSVGMGVSKAIKDAMTQLHMADKNVESTDQLLVSFH